MASDEGPSSDFQSMSSTFSEPERSEIPFKLQILNSFLNLISLTYLSFALIIIIGRTISILDYKPVEQDEAQWKVSVLILNFINFLIFFLILYNRFVNNKGIKREVQMRNYSIFSFIISPMLPLSICFITIRWIDILRSPLKNIYTVPYFSLILMLIGILVLLHDINSMNFESFKLQPDVKKIFHNFVHRLVTFICIFFFFFHFIEMMTKLFFQYLNQKHNLTIASDSNFIQNYIGAFWWILDQTMIIFLLVSLINLLAWRSIGKNFNALHSSFRSMKKIPVFPITTTGIILLLSLIPLPMILNINFDYTFRSNPIVYSTIMTIGILVSIIGILSCYVQIREMKNWKKLKNLNFKHQIIDRIFIWLGLMGRTVIILGFLDFYKSENYGEVNIRITYCVSLIHESLILLQTISQTICLEIAIDRKLKRPARLTLAKKICPHFILIGVNIDFVVLGIYDSYLMFKEFETETVKIYHVSSKVIGSCLSIAQILHAILYFIYMHKNL